MQRITTALFVALMMLVTAVSTGVAANKPAAQISFEQRTYDFGNIAEDGGPARHTFTFTNTGNAPLVIINAVASCGCTQPRWEADPVAPGKTGTVRVTYLPEGRPGEFSKTVTVRTNDPKAKKVVLKITGVVIPKK